MKPLPKFPKPYTKASFDYKGSANATDVTLAMSQLWHVMLETSGCDKLDAPKFSTMEISMFRELYDEYGDGLYNYWVTSSMDIRLKQKCSADEASKMFRQLLTGK